MNDIIFYIIIAVLIIAFISLIIGIYNKLILLKNNVDKSFANIDVLLKQRADEIPNLIQVVKESKSYESETLLKLTQLRTDFMQATTIDDKVNISNNLEKTLKSIMAISENYPDLKANNNFRMLQSRVSGIEDMIADRRELYNDSVNLYNIGIQEFPNLMLAKSFLYVKKPLLNITDQEKHYDGVKF